MEAQDAADQPDSAPPTALLEELVVTGTRIFGQEGTSAPLIQFDNAALEENPTTTLSEFFRENLTAMTAFSNDIEERSMGPRDPMATGFPALICGTWANTIR